MTFNRNLSDNKSPQDSRTLLSSPNDFNSAVVWMVSILPFIPIAQSAGAAEYTNCTSAEG